jgi:alpha-L-fucosidase 2
MNPNPGALLFLALSCACIEAQAQPAPASLQLWYEHPAEAWVEALPLGNGRLGAMVYGGVEREHLQLNESTLIAGEPPADLRSIRLTKDLPHVEQLIRDRRYAEADAYIATHWLGRSQQPYEPLGDL